MLSRSLKIVSWFEQTLQNHAALQGIGVCTNTDFSIDEVVSMIEIEHEDWV